MANKKKVTEEAQSTKIQMILLDTDVQILTSSGWKDINGQFNIIKDKVAVVYDNHFHYEHAIGFYIVKTKFKLFNYASQYTYLSLTEPSRLLHQHHPSCNNKTGTVATPFSAQFFEEITEKDALDYLKTYIVLDKDNMGSLRDVPYEIIDQLQQLATHCGLPSQIQYSNDILTNPLPTLYVGCTIQSCCMDMGFPQQSPYAACITTATGTIICRTLFKNQWNTYCIQV